MAINRPEDRPQAVKGITVMRHATLTRPDNTTQYAAGDIVADATSGATVLAVPSCASRKGGAGVVSAVQCHLNSNQSTSADLELWIFKSQPTAQQDNAAADFAQADLTDRIGVVDLGDSPDVADAGSGADGKVMYAETNVNLPFECTDDTDSLYIVPVVRNAYTPIAEEELTVMLSIFQD
jgi:hypothetical protein